MTPSYTLFVLSHASDKHYVSKYWGTDAWAVPPPQFVFGDCPSPVPLGLRLCWHRYAAPPPSICGRRRRFLMIICRLAADAMLVCLFILLHFSCLHDIAFASVENRSSHVSTTIRANVRIAEFVFKNQI